MPAEVAELAEVAEPAEPAQVVFTPAGVRGSVAIGTTVLDAARSIGIDLDSTCGGRGLCGRCQITVQHGEFAKWQIHSTDEALSPWSSKEATYKGRRKIAASNRLGCQARVQASLVVDVPAESAVHRPVVRKSINLEGLTVDPIITARFIEVPQQQLGDELSQSDLVLQALANDWGIEDAKIDARVLGDLNSAITKEDGKLTAIVHSNNLVVAVRPGFDDEIFGVAVDVGSTTIAGYLIDLANGEVVANAGAMNPQIRFGEDLMSRVSYVMMNPDGDRKLTEAVRGALSELIDEFASEIGLASDELQARIHDLVFVGNPIMHHLLLGIDPTPLGAAPFTLATSAPVDLRAQELDLRLPFATAHVGPCIAGHVGADAAAAVLNEGTHLAERPQLMVDIGTNAEIVLGTPGATYAASSPTGPAFEGAQISSGMRATAGAIERIRIDRQTLEPRYKVIGSNLWSDHPNFGSQTAKLDIAGLCGSAIIEAIGEMFLAGVCDSNGVIGEGAAQRSDYVVRNGRTFSYVIRSGARPLYVTQNDVRQIQLAAAALRAGIDLLMEHAQIEKVDDIRLAGAFGSHIDPLYALVLGLVPDCPPEAVLAVGNSSGAGAVRMLVSATQRRQIATDVVAIEKIETATEARFQELFVAAMAFPHKSAPSTELSKVVSLPAAALDTAKRSRKRGSKSRAN